jgi:hypothetical protein
LSAVPLVADFSILYAVDRPELKLEMKAYQLDDDHRDAFRLKVGFNFGRPEEEDEPAAVPPAPPS